MNNLTINFIAGPFLPIPPIKGGGIEIYLYNLALELSKRHKVRIYSRIYPGLKDHETIGNLEIIRVKGFDKGRLHLLADIEELFFGIALCSKIEKADINHFFHLKSFLIYLLRAKKGKIIVHLQIAFGGFTSKFLRFADRAVASSKYLEGYFRKIGAISTDRLSVIPNGVDIDRFKMAEPDNKIKRRYNLTGHKVIGYVGRITKGKGLECLIDAFKMIRAKRDDAKFLLIGPYKDSEYGDPAFHNHIISRIKGYGLGHLISFTGLIRHEELPRYYATCDILVFPSEWEEPFGIVCIEALSCGKPVIVTDSGAFREIIANNLNGFIVPKRDPEKIAENVLLLLANDNLRNRISGAAIESAKFYSFESIAEKYEELYRQLI